MYAGTGNKCYLRNKWNGEVSCRAILKITPSGSQQVGAGLLITFKSFFMVVIHSAGEHQCSIYTNTHRHNHRQESNWHLITGQWAEAIIIILIFPCYCRAEHQDAIRLHPTTITWLIKMPGGESLWVELISRVRSFRHPPCTELNTVSKTADQQDTKCSNSTHRRDTWQVCGRTSRRTHTYIYTSTQSGRSITFHAN